MSGEDSNGISERKKIDNQYQCLPHSGLAGQTGEQQQLTYRVSTETWHGPDLTPNP